MKEKLYIWLAHKLPHQLVYWCGIRLAAHATSGVYSSQIAPDLTLMDALRRWPL